MSIRIDHLLRQWYPLRDQREWVLGTIIDTQLSTYRKAGSMMLFDSLGQSYGMLSGGCLEGDLMTNARKTMFSGKAQIVYYDLQDESDINWQRSVGCGGAMTVLLQTVNADNHYLGLEKVHFALEAERKICYQQRVDKPGLTPQHWRAELLSLNNTRLVAQLDDNRGSTITQDDGKWLTTVLAPAPKIMIFGGGLDAVPLARLAQDIGWHVAVVDSRVGNTRAALFPDARLFRSSAEELSGDENPDAIVIMTHNLSLDMAALKYAQRSSARYVGVLGPRHRRERLERLAGIDAKDFRQFYSGPMGLDIGARLPETIALSILAECHRVVESSATVFSQHRHTKKAHVF